MPVPTARLTSTKMIESFVSDLLTVRKDFPRPMSDAAKVRVRWFRRSTEQVQPAGEDLHEACETAAAQDPTILITAEADGGNGRVHCVAIGGAGVVWSAEEIGRVADPVLRRWEVDGAAEDVGSASNLDLLLSEYQEAFREEGIESPRVLTAETNRPSGEILVLEVSYFDPSQSWLFEDDDSAG